jgi:tryptophan 2,3-dioxygenase
MDPDQFLKFRMSLLPASGFQSVQYRQIELESTSVWNLLRPEARHTLDPESDIAMQFPELYWKSGNLELSTGKKTLTLRIFEERYDAEMLELSEQMATQNIWALYLQLPHDERENEELKALLREYDLFANVFWALSHYKSAVRYLQRDPDVIAATGGTNWQKYLPPRFQRVVYFPALWSEEEVAEWGKAWVMELFREKVETNWGKVKRNG